MGGGTTETKTDTEESAISQEAKANQLWSNRLASAMPFTPYMGPVAAAFSPQEIAGMEGTNTLAAAFGMPTAGPVAESIPTPQEYAGGIQGYSTFPQFNQMLAAYQDLYPGAFQYLSGFTIPPQMELPNEYTAQLFNEDGRRRTGGKSRKGKARRSQPEMRYVGRNSGLRNQGFS
jgi:hypothetical protein